MSHNSAVVVKPTTRNDSTAHFADSNDNICSIAFSHDGRLLSIGASKPHLRIYDLLEVDDSSQQHEPLCVVENALPSGREDRSVNLLAFEPGCPQRVMCGEIDETTLSLIDVVLGIPMARISVAAPIRKFLWSRRDAAEDERALDRLVIATKEDFLFYENKRHSYDDMLKTFIWKYRVDDRNRFLLAYTIPKEATLMNTMRWNREAGRLLVGGRGLALFSCPYSNKSGREWRVVKKNAPVHFYKAEVACALFSSCERFVFAYSTLDTSLSIYSAGGAGMTDASFVPLRRLEAGARGRVVPLAPPADQNPNLVFVHAIIDHFSINIRRGVLPLPDADDDDDGNGHDPDVLLFAGGGKNIGREQSGRRLVRMIPAEDNGKVAMATAVFSRGSNAPRDGTMMVEVVDVAQMIQM